MVTRPVIYGQNFREAYALVARAYDGDEAVEALTRVAASKSLGNTAGYWGALAVALAGVGRADRAVEAIRRARSFGQDPNGTLAAFEKEIAPVPVG